jgi:hypothetical protein
LDGKEAELRRMIRLPVHTRMCLNAMKLYILFLAYRNHRFDTTAIGYEAIMEHTGMRRADIPDAFSLLVSHELVRASDEIDEREQDKSKRYRVLGLGRLIRVTNAEQAGELMAKATTTAATTDFDHIWD